MDNGGVFDYWLRNFAKFNSSSDLDNKKRAAIVNFMGIISTYRYEEYTLSGVRPAIWVSLN